MISNSWSIKLSQQPLHSTICNIPQPSIIFQGISNQLIAHSNNENIPLPIRKQVLSLNSLPSNQVLILTRYDLSCWDLINNNETFTKEFQNAQKLFVSENYIYVVCGSDLFCYTHAGEEQYVNHLSSGITTIESCQLLQGEEVLIGTEDMSMIRYKNLNAVLDYGKVVGTLTSICWIQAGALVGTQEGPIAYYESKKSKWKAKSTHPVVKILNFKKKQTHNTLVFRKNGTVELRDWKKGKFLQSNLGQTISKIKIGEPTVGIQLYDFRQQSHQQIICICKSSNVKAFNLDDQAKVQKHKAGDEITDQIKKIDALLKQRTNLQFQIQQLEDQLENTGDDNIQEETPLSANFEINATLNYKKGLQMNIKCTEGFISGLSFEQPILPVKADRSQTLTYVFQNQNKIAGQIDCQALVHSSFSTKSYDVKTFKIILPKFWHWGHTTQIRNQIKGCVKFNLVQRNARYLKWIKQCFYTNLKDQQIPKMQNLPIMKMRFYNYYQDTQLEFVFKTKQGKVEIYCDSIQIMGDVIQDLMEYTGGKQLDSELYFPKQKERLKEVLGNIERLSQTKVSINSEMAEAINNIKFMLVKGQSSLAVGNLNGLRKAYGQVMGQNKNILLELDKKSSNTASLSDSLKILGKFINQTSNVRYGSAKQTLVAQCRQAIKNKNFPRIVSLMERGLTAI